MEKDFEKLLILDFGSQYTQLIARKIRELNVYSEIVPYNISIEKIKRFNPRGIILSGGPKSVYSLDAYKPDPEIFNLGIPILGICYGLQLISQHFGGLVLPSEKREFGKTFLIIDDNRDLFKGFKLDDKIQVWMSHGDRVEHLPPGFEVIAHTKNSPFATVANKSRTVFGVQFHPEVSHTPQGKEILNNFLELCGFSRDWNMNSFVETEIKKIRDTVGNNKIICALSGGIDSSVVATLLGKAIGKNTKAVFINNGLLRKGEVEEILDTFKAGFNFDLIYVDARKRFLTKLKNVDDPEEKRKIIGNEFIKIFEEKAKELGDIKYLAQGTLYPDVIESTSFKGPSAKIKSHHNVGGLPEKMKLQLIEPLRELFKDEVREIGKILGIPKIILERHPFPGPGLAVRVLGDITEVKLSLLREADAIIIDEIKKGGLYNKIWQAFGVLLPLKSVGVMGDERTYEKVCVVRAVSSIDGMTADWYKIPHEILERISSRITSEVNGINRVVYDITSKPPGTIEWE